MSARLRAATRADLPRVEHLLVDAGLITAGVAEHIEQFILAEDNGHVVGSAGLERYGAQALLRSVAVAPQYRNHGLGRTLVRRVLDGALRDQVREVYLFTISAPEYFRLLGFKPIGRDDVADSVRASQEYGECCSGAQAMVLRLRKPSGWEDVDDPSG